MNHPNVYGAQRLPDHSVTGHGATSIFLLHGAFGAKEYWLRQTEAWLQQAIE